jgi:hypothetical protein
VALGSKRGRWSGVGLLQEIEARRRCLGFETAASTTFTIGSGEVADDLVMRLVRDRRSLE